MARIFDTQAVDFVGRPAANPGGLLSIATPEITKMNYDPKYKSAMAQFGLPAEANDEQAAAFFAAMPPDKQAACAAMSQTPAPTPETSVEIETETPVPAAPAQMSAKPAVDVIALEMKRVSQIRQLASILPNIGEEQINKAIGSRLDVEGAQTAFLAHVAANNKPDPSSRVDPTLRPAPSRRTRPTPRAPTATARSAGRDPRPTHAPARPPTRCRPP